MAMVPSNASMPGTKAPMNELASGRPFAVTVAVAVEFTVGVAFAETDAMADADGIAVAFTSGVATAWITVRGPSITVADAWCKAVGMGVAVGTGVTLGCT